MADLGKKMQLIKFIYQDEKGQEVTAERIGFKPQFLNLPNQNECKKRLARLQLILQDDSSPRQKFWNCRDIMEDWEFEDLVEVAVHDTPRLVPNSSVPSEPLATGTAGSPQIVKAAAQVDSEAERKRKLIEQNKAAALDRKRQMAAVASAPPAAVDVAGSVWL